MLNLFYLKYPSAQIPSQTRTAVTIPCIHCGEIIGLKRWESWNNFLVVCPYCKRFHGKKWGIQAALMGSLLFLGFSFFFTMRPRFALLFCISYFCLLYFTYNLDLNPILSLLHTFSLFFAPMIINITMFFIHEIDLDRSSSNEELAENVFEMITSLF